ncbi:hypothetical protein DIGNKC_213 [Bacillus phage DIGNKC]|uniref:hypothetical protein n=1 Tax=Bacillus phage DIGNKC TaxID=1805948 RepID=UPI0007A76A4A|nr:hypothetical protein BI007_gp161 [Bacillus phage DIGNKC]AMW62920.1 hypothetical protein DIGNKC_213 [Bacillus phage DIGNKC]AOZ61839.1 hypothetical protein BJ4_216 [Bacillus phage BJ4]AOZ62468.1 hypothetical protein SBP8a_218 [Bacillus phage SBP8a]
MMYADIPHANAMRTVSTLHRTVIDTGIAKDIRESIVKEIDESAKRGNTACLLSADRYDVLSPIFTLFNRYDEFNYIIKEFENKGYSMKYTPALESKLVGGMDTPPHILVSWEKITLEKGDDK